MITRKATPKPQHLEKGGHPPHNSKPSVSRYTKPYTHISVRKQHPNTQTPTNTPPNYQQIHTLECSEQDLLTKMRIWCDFWKGRNWGSTKSSRFVIFRAGMLVSAYLPPTQYIVAPPSKTTRCSGMGESIIYGHFWGRIPRYTGLPIIPSFFASDVNIAWHHIPYSIV